MTILKMKILKDLTVVTLGQFWREQMTDAEKVEYIKHYDVDSSKEDWTDEIYEYCGGDIVGIGYILSLRKERYYVQYEEDCDCIVIYEIELTDNTKLDGYGSLIEEEYWRKQNA